MASPPNLSQDPAAAAAEADMRARMAEYGPALRRYFLKKTDPNEADDLVQEVFLKMQTAHPAQAVDNIEGYLFRVASSVLIDRQRRPGWNWSRSEPLGEGSEPRDELTPERTFLGRETLAFVMTSLKGLPPRTSEAFVLHRFEEMTYPAIARRMGVSVGTVEKLISRAVKRLLECARARP